MSDIKPSISDDGISLQSKAKFPDSHYQAFCEMLLGSKSRSMSNTHYKMTDCQKKLFDRLAETGVVVIQSTPRGKSRFYEICRMMKEPEQTETLKGFEITEMIFYEHLADIPDLEKPKAEQPSYTKLQNKYNTGRTKRNA